MAEKKGWNVAVLGATGLVGETLIRILEERDFPVAELYPLASNRSLGKSIEFRGKKYPVIDVESFDFAQAQIGLFSAGGEVSRLYAPKAAAAGCVVIDNTSEFRYDDDVPLVIPEVNPQHVGAYKARGIIANPNCSTAVMLMGLWPLHQAFGVKRIFVSTYQSVSGTGAEAVQELAAQIKAHVGGKPMPRKVYPYQIAFNCIPQVDSFGADGYTGEETKMAQESRKIMGLSHLRVSATCVRVPVVRAHSISVSAEFERPVDLATARAAIAAFPGAALVDEPTISRYPTPLDFAEKVKCGVGRIRIDTALDNGLSFWVSGDNLWKGAALNAIQNAEWMVREGVILERGELATPSTT